MDDYNKDVKSCPFGQTVMGVSATGVHIIARRYASCVKRDSASGRSINVAKLDPITGRQLGTMTIVKWKPFNGDFAKNKVEKPKDNSMTYPFKNPILTRNAMKKYKISAGVAYRWMRDGLLPYHYIGRNRYVPKDKFFELACKHIYREPHKPKRSKRIVRNAVVVAPVVTKRWWQFWK